MNRKIIYLSILLVVVLAGLAAGFYYKDKLAGWYDDAAQNMQNFKKSDLGNTIQAIAQKILTPGPLNIGGQPNDVELVKAKIIAQTNIQRYDNGQLLPLIENVKLNAAARAKADDMFKKQYFEHVSPSGTDPGTLVKNFGYDYIASGESLILGNFSSEAEVVQDWMNSPGHRANILNNRFVDIGVAIVKGMYKGQTVWIGVQEFGLPLSSCTSPSADLKVQIDKNIKELDRLSLQIEAKKSDIDAADKHSEEYNIYVDQYNNLVAKYNELNQTTKNIIGEYNVQVNNFNRCILGK